MVSGGITKQIGEALKAHDETRLSTLRMLSSALNYERIAKQHELSEEEELIVVRKEARKRQDAIEAYEKVRDRDRARERIEKEKKELEILKEYLPEELSGGELEKLVTEAMNETGVKSLSEMGRVIGAVMAKAGGRADGKNVAEMVKTKLS